MSSDQKNIDKVCRMTVSSNRSGFNVMRYECDRPTKYTVSFVSGVTGKPETHSVCGVHKKSFESYAKRIKKITGYDVKLVVKEIKR